MTRKLFVLLFASVVALGMAALPAGAAITPIQHIQVHDASQTLPPGPNPCSGTPVTTTTNYHMVVNVFLDPTGDIHGTINENGTLTSVPADPTAPTFTGTFHSSNTFNGPPGTLPGGEFTFIETVNGQFSDGTHAGLQIHQHITFNANLVVTVSFDNLTCRS